MPYTDIALSLDDVRFTGRDLDRPECVLATSSGDLFVSALGSGVLRISQEGKQIPVGRIEQVDGCPFIPNGFAMEADGSFLIANIGESGGVWRLHADGLEWTAKIKAVLGRVGVPSSPGLGSVRWHPASTR